MQRTFTDKKAYELPREWKMLIRRMGTWVQSDSDRTARFAILQGSRACGKSTKIPRYLSHMLANAGSGPRPRVVHVASESEAPFLRAYDAALEAAPSSEGPQKVQVERASYQQCLRLMTLNLEMVSRHLSLKGQGKQWPDILPRFAFDRQMLFMLEIDAHMSAECADALVTLLTWCAEAGTCEAPLGPYRIAVVVMVSGNIHPTIESFVEQVVAHTDSFEGVKMFLAPRPSETTPPVDITVAPDDIKQRLLDDLKASTEAGRVRIVVCFEVPILEDGFSDVRADNLKVVEMSNVVQDWMESEQFRRRENQARCHRLVILRDRFHAPIQIDGFDEVTIVTTSVASRGDLDWNTGHPVGSIVQLSQQEILDQQAFRYRVVDLPHDRITVYNVQDRPVAFEGRPAATACSTQLSGFLASIARLSTGGPIIDRALRVLSSDSLPRLVIDRSVELQQMGIIDREMNHGNGMIVPRCSLVDTLGQDFYRVLPIFDYDANLAYLAALPCQHGAVKAVQIQLACLLHHARERIFEGLDLQSFADRADAGGFLAECHGYTTCILKQSPLWFLLAVWKSAVVKHRGFDPALLTHNRLGNTVSILGGFGKIVADESARALDMMRDVSFRISAPDAAAQIYTETPSMPPAAILELQWHMMKCFASRCVAVRMRRGSEPPWDNTVRLDFKAVQIVNIHAVVPAVVDIEQLCLAESSTLVYGVSVSRMLFHHAGPRWAMDWTFIPRAIVAHWLRGPGDGNPAIDEVVENRCHIGRNPRLWTDH